MIVICVDIFQTSAGAVAGVRHGGHLHTDSSLHHHHLHLILHRPSDRHRVPDHGRAAAGTVDCAVEECSDLLQTD